MERLIVPGSAFVKIWGILSWCLLVVLILLGLLSCFDYIFLCLIGSFGILEPGYYPDDIESIQRCISKYASATEHYKSILRTFTLAFAAYIVISVVFVYPRAVRPGNSSSPFKWYTTLGITILFLFCIPAALMLMYGITLRYECTPHNVWSNVLAAIVIAFILFSIYMIFRTKKHEAVIFKHSGMSCFLLAVMALSIILFEYCHICGDFDPMPIQESEVDHAISRYKQCATWYVTMTPILNLLFIAYIISTISWMSYWKNSADLTDPTKNDTLQ